MTADEINAFLAQGFPDGTPPHVEIDARGVVRCRLAYRANQLRPGGTLSGPTMMALADTAMYALIFAKIGFLPLAVTTNLSINFLRKPAPADLIAEARLLKRGKALVVGDVLITSHGETEPCAHAVVTYSIPPNQQRA
jgi:uncharacterized protein (TIGR00369 family)